MGNQVKSAHVLDVEEAARYEHLSDEDLQALVFDPRYSVLAQEEVNAPLEHDYQRLYRWLLFPLFFDPASLWGFIKYFFWATIKKPKGRERLGLQVLDSFLFGGCHPLLRRAHFGVTSWVALAILYSAMLLAKGKHGWRWVLFRLWMAHPECQAVRNRYRIARKSIYDELIRRSGSKEIRVLSLACGTGGAVLHAVGLYKRTYPTGADVTVTLVDINHGSLEKAKRLAEILGVKVEVCEEDVDRFVERAHADHQKFHIIDEVGYLEYRPDIDFVDNCKAVRCVLDAGGLFVTAQIGPSRTGIHRRWTIGWLFMIQRTQEQFKRLLVLSGYDERFTAVATEPNGIYHVAACRRII